MPQTEQTVPRASSWRDRIREEFFPRNRRRDIDGLRGLAITFVVLFHAGWLQGGFIGVDIFVVISGYLMGRSALMQHPFQPVRFVCRRLYRLLPALTVMIAVVSASMLWWVLPGDRADIALNGAYALTYLSNIWASGHVGYFEGQSIAYPFLHTWSLSLEMQFYALVFIMALLLPLTRHRKFVLSAIFALSLGYCLFSHFKGETQAYYNISDRIWQFSLGTLIWIFPRPNLSVRAAGLIHAMALMVLVGAGLFYTLAFACPSGMMVFPCGAVAAILMLPETWLGRLCLVPLSPLGVMSYSVYLWHWPGLVIANYLLPAQVYGLTIAAVMGIVLVISLLSYLCIERTGLDYEEAVPVVVRNRGAVMLVGAGMMLAAILFYISYVSRVH
ncbi:acyltransferase [Komagataeibacter sp. FNDCF1]|uniref:acyltransferase family protein n=1 Tax=Komagataeibacter sp. FNDCF1 TaxID=2878681 RepID=UPI001E4FA348|nr:acyltransferase [Komagataeibacter sp. FNDCF1]MCE2566103.1 acyltransferase [Komagataeibacter sp. FNDCF1]